MVGKDQRAARTQAIGDQTRKHRHIAGRQIIEELSNDDGIVERPWRCRGSDQLQRAGAGRVSADRVRHELNTLERGFGRIEAQTPGGKNSAVRAVACAKFQHPADLAGCERMKDRIALERLVPIRPGTPRVGVAGEFVGKSFQRNGPGHSHEKFSRGLANAAR